VLRVVEEAARSDTGRQRTDNEDAYFARSPVFVVADGMGGAKAGEVAARIAADAFDADVREDTNPEQELARIASEANRRIFELARSDSSRSGMGTTLTGMLLSHDEISIVHVGDSRAYLFRDGELRQLTRDHSLVEELRRRGQLTADEAEEHPQRSIITRALGPEANVDLDLHTHQARSGDVFLLCSDGLTSMVREEKVHDILSASRSLEQAVNALVSEANRMGGRDNITVVLFRIAGDEDSAAERSETAEQTAVDIDAAKVREAAATRPMRPRSRRRRARAGLRRRERERRPKAGKQRRRRLRVALISLSVVIVLAGLSVGAVAGIRSAYFIGQNDRGLVTLYRGLPYELPAGVKLYSSQYVSSVQTSTLRPFERRRLLNHEIRSRSDAAKLIRSLEQGE
jgi:serine/threonine protein phosphatase PrpC